MAWRIERRVELFHQLFGVLMDLLRCFMLFESLFRLYLVSCLAVSRLKAPRELCASLFGRFNRERSEAGDAVEV